MAGLAIFIACLGLFGLSQLESVRRTKEMGIRKVLGASETNLLMLFARNFTLLVVIAMLIAIPCAYFGLDQWLSNFAFRIELQWWVFPLAGVLAIIIAVGTISLHAWRSVRANPVESLRYE
jgi:putative ABC transport system permease protein